MADDPNDPQQIKQALANINELQNIMRSHGTKFDEPVLFLGGTIYVQEFNLPDGSVWVSVVALKQNCGKPDCQWCKGLPPSGHRVHIDLRE